MKAIMDSLSCLQQIVARMVIDGISRMAGLAVYGLVRYPSHLASDCEPGSVPTWSCQFFELPTWPQRRDWFDQPVGFSKFFENLPFRLP